MKSHSPVRKGLSLVEVIVVVFLIAMLAALVLPGVQGARISSRSGECRNNLSNIGVAIFDYTIVYGCLPAAGVWDVPADDAGACDSWRLDWSNGAPGPGAKYMRYSWAVLLLPYLERSDIHDQWEFERDSAGVPTFGSYLSKSTPKNPARGNAALAETPVKVLRCPSDPTCEQGRGNLSYVMNGGFSYHWRMQYAGNGAPRSKLLLADWNQTEARRISENLWNMGLFSMQTSDGGPAPRRERRWSSIDNGLAHTAMMSENINAGRYAYWENESLSSNWACPHPWNTCFFINGASSATGAAFAADPRHHRLDRANVRGSDAPPINPCGGEGGINGDLSGANEVQAPYPNSEHKGGVNVLLCDGNVQFINQSIDGSVWAKLVIPNPGELRRLATAAADGNQTGGTQKSLNDEF